MPYARKEYDIRICDHKDEAKKQLNVDGTYQVLVKGTPVEATIYANDNTSTAASNPGTIVDGQIRFFMDSSVTGVDVSIYTSDGDAKFMRNVQPEGLRRALIDPDQVEQLLVIGLDGTTSDETDTGFTLVGPCEIEDIWLQIVTVDAGETIDVGTDGTTTNDPDGLIDGMSIATVGTPDVGPTYTAGSNEVYISANVRGALLADFTAGADTTGDTGTHARRTQFIAEAEDDANITYSASAGVDTFDGYLYIKLLKLIT